MTVAALPGNVRLRHFQLGIQSTFGTGVPATRRFPWKYTPTTEPHWTSPTADTGTLDEAIAPYRLAGDFTGQAVGSLAYNDVNALLAATVKGGVSPTGGGPNYSATFTPASTTQDAFDVFSAEWGDETTDQYQFTGGVVNQLQLQYPEDLGPIQATADFRFGAVSYPNVNQSLSVDFAPTWVFAADTQFYLNDSSGTIETTAFSNALHGATVTIMNNLDVKRFLNGSNTRFQAQGYGRGARTLEATFTFAKNSSLFGEVTNWLTSGNAVERFVGLKTTSPVTIGGVNYSLDLRFPGFWFENTPGTYATNNTTNVMKLRGILDQSLAYPFTATVVNGIAAVLA